MNSNTIEWKKKVKSDNSVEFTFHSMSENILLKYDFYHDMRFKLKVSCLEKDFIYFFIHSKTQAET